jgi:arabinofuranan 3-O-arabinosyltransferase
VTGLRLVTTAGSGAATPAEVHLTSSAGTVRRTVGADGTVEFAGRTDRLEITVTRVAPGVEGPAGISAVEVAGVPFPRVGPDTPVRVPCGAGPVVRVDGRDYDTAVTGTVADVQEHRALPFTTCPDMEDGLALAAGDHELRTTRTADFVVQDVWLRPAGAAGVHPRERAVTALSWGVAHRELRVADGPAAVLAVRENANAGWVATADGKPLARTRVDGWQQAWLVPPGATTVVLEFTPDGAYRTRLLAGSVVAVVLVAAAVVPGRRRPDRPGPPGPSARPGRGAWVPWVLAVLLVALGGMAGLVALLACLFVCSLAPARRRAISMGLAFGGMAGATAISVTGRLLGHGQEWAYGTAAQACVLVALAAVVSVRVRWLDRA